MREGRKALLLIVAAVALLLVFPLATGAFEESMLFPYIVATELSDHYSFIDELPDSIRPGMRLSYRYSDESMQEAEVPDPIFGIDPQSRAIIVFDVAEVRDGAAAIYESSLQGMLGTSMADVGYYSSTGWKGAGPFWANPEILLESQQPKDPTSPSSAQKLIDYQGEKIIAQTFLFVGDDEGRIEASYDKQTGILLKMTYTAPEGGASNKDSQQSFELVLESIVELEPAAWSLGSTDAFAAGLELEYDGKFTFSMVKGLGMTEGYSETIRIASNDGFFTKIEVRTPDQEDPYVWYQYSGAPDSMPYYLPPERLAHIEADAFLFFDDTFPSIVRAGKASLDAKYGRVMTIEFTHGTSTTIARYSMETGWLVSYYRTLELLFIFEIDVRLKSLPNM